LKNQNASMISATIRPILKTKKNTAQEGGSKFPDNNADETNRGELYNRLQHLEILDKGC